MTKVKFRQAGLASVINSITTGVTLFFIFRVAVSSASISAVGCWALMQGLFVLTRIADSGAGANVTRVIAASGGVRLRSVLLASVALSTLPVAILGSLLIWPLAWYVGGRYATEFEPSDFINIAVSCWIFAVSVSLATLLLAICEGLGRLTAKSYVSALSNVVAMSLAVPLIGRYQLTGIGVTYAVLGLTQALGASTLLYLLRKSSCGSQSIGELVKLLWKENLQLSLVGVIRLSFEPVTKFLLSLVAPLASIAAFDLALKVGTQARVLLQAGVQPLLVLGSRRGISMEGRIFQKFNSVGQLLVWSAIATCALQFALSPSISWLGLGRIDPVFLTFLGILVAANTINAMGLTGYYFQLSSGRLRPLVVIQVVMAIMNLTGGTLAALTVGTFGIACAYGFAFVYGGVAQLRIWLHNAPKNSAKLLFEQVGWPEALCLLGGVGLAAGCCILSLTQSSQLPVAIQLLGSAILAGVLVARSPKALFRSKRESTQVISAGA